MAARARLGESWRGRTARSPVRRWGVLDRAGISKRSSTSADLSTAVVVSVPNRRSTMSVSTSQHGAEAAETRLDRREGCVYPVLKGQWVRANASGRIGVFGGNDVNSRPWLLITVLGSAIVLACDRTPT